MHFRLAFFLIFFTVFRLSGQSKLNAEMYNRIVEIAEQTIESSESNAEFNTFLENLEYYALHPINVNTASQEDLQDLGLITDLEIQQIFDYKTHLQSFVEIDELFLAGIDKSKVQILAIFLTVKENSLAIYSKPKEVLNKLDHQLFLRQHRILESQKGYQQHKYEGDPSKYYFRYSANYMRNFQLGVVLEKDEGESFYKGSNTFEPTKPLAGFDYRNGYILLKTNGLAIKSVLGAYTLQLGQGLLTWSGLALGKSVYATQARKNGMLIKPYSSANENLYFKGFATQIQYKKVLVLPYFSTKLRDASLAVSQDSLQNIDSEIASVSINGFHRTISEIANEKQIRETIFGLSLGTKIKKMEFRVNNQLFMYSKSLAQGDNLYEKMDFSANQLLSTSIDYKYIGDRWLIFGESAVQSSKKTAHLLGGLLQLHPKIDLISIFRNYSSGYFAPYSNGFGERRGTSNEKGMFVGFEIRPQKSWIINGYIDNYSKPWLTSATSAPSSGTDFIVQINQQKGKYFAHYIRLKHEISQTNALASGNIKHLEQQQTFRFRYHISYIPSKQIDLKTRLEISGNKQAGNTEIGTLLYQDIKISTFKYKLDWTARLAFFNTPSFNTASYAYESDVLFFFSVPAYYNQGVRYYLMGAYDVSKKIKIWLRYSRWVYTDKSTISSGNSEISGDTKSEFRVQLRYVF